MRLEHLLRGERYDSPRTTDQHLDEKSDLNGSKRVLSHGYRYFRRLLDNKAKYRLVLPTNRDGQGELKSSYQNGANVVGWTDPFKDSINFGPLDSPLHISLGLRRKARMDFHGHNVCLYSFDLVSDCKSRDVIFQASPSPNGITNPPEIHATVTVTGLARDTAHQIVMELDATNPAAYSSPLPPQIDASGPDTTSSDLANVGSLAVHEPRPAADPSEDVTHSASSVPIAHDVPLVSQLDAAQGATREALDRQTKLRDRELPLSVLAGNDATPDVTAVGVATWDAAQCVKFLVEVLDNVAEIHPIANAAWKIVTLAYKLKEQQSQTDEEVERLVKSMDANCRLASVLVRNELASTTVPILRNILEAVLNGATVIEQYCRIRQSFLSSFKLVGSTIASRIEACLEVLAALERELGSHTVANIQHELQTVMLTLSRNHDDLLVRLKRLDEDLLARKSEALLSDMLYASEADRDLRRDTGGCLPQTRGEVIQAIVDWATNSVSNASAPHLLALDNSSRVLWICGVAGSGKSSIAISVARKLRSMDRLGALYRFEVARRGDLHLDPSNLFSTIIRQLAERRPAFKSRLLLALDHVDRDLRASTSPSAQFSSLLATLLADSASKHDDAVVIDAFDESAENNAVDRLAALKALTPSLESIFPKRLRFIVTSRYDPDIAQRLELRHRSHSPLISVLRMEDLERAHTERDIRVYVMEALRGSDGLEHATEKITKLAMAAKESFQWASAACGYITASDSDGATPPVTRLERILRLGTSDGLDSLYRTILDQHFAASIRAGSVPLRAVLGALVCSFEPVSVHVMMELAGVDVQSTPREVDMSAYRTISRNLASLIIGTNLTSSPLIPLHTSFIDFLRVPERGEAYAIPSSETHMRLALGSLRVMKQSLRFNICDLKTSLLRNNAVPDLAEQIKKHVPDELSYACRFWPAHVAAALSSASDEVKHLRSALGDLLGDKILLLNWLEVMSLLRANALQALSPLSFLQTENRDLSDLITFTTYFAIPISTSVPHIYLSALAFAPSSSPIASIRLHFPKLVQSDSPLASWPQIRHSFSHGTRINCVAFAPDGQRVVSGAESGEITVWDVYSGSSILPRMSASGAIRSIAISRDGSLLASGSEHGTIQLWDMRTLSAVGEPVKAHSDWVGSVIFSPDGRLLASGSDDHTIRLWDLQGGLAVQRASATHDNYILSLAFSPNGELLASGSRDGLVRLWDVPSLSPVGEPLRGHTDWVRSVKFSPDGALLVSGSYDKTIRFWNVQARAVIGEHLPAHDSPIHSVNFSPDGQTLASCSEDRTIQLWDVRTRSLAGVPLTGHTGAVNSVAFSPDGALLASGSSDKTVHIWDARVLNSNRESPATQFKIQDFAAFSGDGKLSASGSDDHAIQLWDVHSVSVVGEPLSGHTDDINCVAFAPNGTLLASGSDDNTVRFWDASTASAAGEPFAGHRDWVRAVAFWPDGKLLASGSDDRTIRLWDTDARSASGDPLTGHSQTVISLAFSPDGSLLASGDAGGTVRLWDVQTRSLIGQALEGHSNYIRCLAFSPDGKLLASGSYDKTVRLWDVHAQSAVGEPLKGHTGYVKSLAFSPDGALLASCSDDTSVVWVWDVRAPSEVGEPVGLLRHESNVHSIAFSPISPLLSSVTSGGVVREWDLGYLLSASRSNLPRNPQNRLQQLPSLLLPAHPDLLTLSPDFYLDLDDGWVVGPQKQLVLWIPPALRPSIDNVRVNARFGGPPLVKLDFSDFVCGSDWSNCYSPPISSSDS